MSHADEVPNKIAVFGSAFNPPSLGHKSVVDSLTHFDCVLLVPSISHAWGKNMLSFELRCEMTRRFIADLSLSNVYLSTIEEELYQPSKTVTTFAVLEQLQRLYPDSDLTFILGPDNLLSFDKFFKASDILTHWSVLACPEKLAVRSTMIRNNIEQSKPVSQLTTRSVHDFILSENLYRS